MGAQRKNWSSISRLYQGPTSCLSDAAGDDREQEGEKTKRAQEVLGMA